MARKLLTGIALSTAIFLSGCAAMSAARLAASDLRAPCPSAQYRGLFWSPDGHSLAALIYVPGLNPQIAVMSPIGSAFRLVAADVTGVKDDMRWSPDGERIAYTANARGRFELYVLTLADGVSRPITERGRNDVMPSWSPDGERLAYVTLDGRADPGNQIFIARPDGGDARLVRAGSALIRSLVWSPDGTRIAYSGGTGASAIYLLDPATGEQTRLTDGQGDDGALAWSPDSRRIAFVSYRDSQTALYTVYADGTGLRLLTEDIDGKAKPVWADAAHVSVVARAPDSRLTLINADSGSGHPVTEMAVDGYFNPPAWSPDGSRVAFVAYGHSNPAMASSEVFLINRDGSGLARLTDNPGKYLCSRWARR